MHVSSSGAHFAALDHVRALAALLVVAWHFLHGQHGQPVPFEGAPAWWPLALFDEGHTGVALFMSLSGYLFARLLEGRRVDFPRFLFNRLLRLLPLLLLVMLLAGLRIVWHGGDGMAYLQALLRGFWQPTWPNGGWSIAVEMHFYLLLPLLLALQARSVWWLWALLALALAGRGLLWALEGTVQHLAYFTLVGRIDQFLLGMLACRWRGHLAGRHVLAAAVALAFCLFYWWFDASGGFYQRPSYPSPGRLWIVLPLIEALAYAVLIAWYEASVRPSMRGPSRWLARAGAYSYSVYLLHFFIVFDAARWVHTHIMDISNFYVACLWALLFYGLMLLPAHWSYRWVEAPFLRLRVPYIKHDEPSSPTARASRRG